MRAGRFLCSLQSLARHRHLVLVGDRVFLLSGVGGHLEMKVRVLSKNTSLGNCRAGRGREELV